MKNCQKCSHKISEKAKFCPSCGHPNKPGTSIFTWIIAGIGATFVFLAFSGGETLKQPPAPTASDSTDAPIELPKGTLIPRPSGSDRANYYLLSQTSTPQGIVTIHSRISAQSTGYTKTLINCASHSYKVLGYSEISPEDTEGKRQDPNFTKAQDGSSKGDLVRFVCK